MLLSDDEPDYGHALTLYFEAEGYDVRHTTEAAETLEWARSWKPHAIITDVAKPKMDGLEMARRLKAADQTSGIPVIVASASCGSEEGRRQRTGEAARPEGLAAVAQGGARRVSLGPPVTQLPPSAIPSHPSSPPVGCRGWTPRRRRLRPSDHSPQYRVLGLVC